MRYRIEHETCLTFSAPVREQFCELRLQPPDTDHQRLRAFTITTEPAIDLTGHVDPFGNAVHHGGVLGLHDRFVIHVAMEVETLLDNPFAFRPLPPTQERAWVESTLKGEPRLWDYVHYRSPATPALATLSDSVQWPAYDPDRPLLENVQAAMAWIGGILRYDPEASHVHSTLAEVVEERAGVCQDYAHLLIAIVRDWGFPARYVMGYVDPCYFAEGETVGAQATHAWTEVLIPNAGWRGFDPTHQLLANNGYITVAVGRDYQDAAPQKGTYKGAAQGSEPVVRVRVERME